MESILIGDLCLSWIQVFYDFSQAFALYNVMGAQAWRQQRKK